MIQPVLRPDESLDVEALTAELKALANPDKPGP